MRASRRVDLAGVVADEDPPVGERGRRLDRRAGVEAPAQASGARGEGVDVSVLAADVDGAAVDERRRLGGADLPPPAHAAGVGRERDELAAVARRMALRVADEGGEEEMVGERRRRPAAEVRVVPPAHAAARRIERVEPPVEDLLEDAAVADDGRELEQVPAVERPEPAERRPHSRRGDRAQAGVVGSVRRPRCRRALRGRRRDRGRRRSRSAAARPSSSAAAAGRPRTRRERRPRRSARGPRRS